MGRNRILPPLIALPIAMDDTLMSGSTLAELLGVSRGAVRKWAVAQGLPCVRVGRHRLYLGKAVRVWLLEQHAARASVAANPR